MSSPDPLLTSGLLTSPLSNEIEKYHRKADDSDELFIAEHLAHDLCLSRAIADIEAAKNLAQNRRSITLFFLHPQLAGDFFKLQQLSEVLPESFALPRSVGSFEIVAQAYRVLNLEVEDQQTGGGSNEAPVVDLRWL